MDSIYYSSSGEEGSFSSLKPLLRAAKLKDRTITTAVVRQYLQTNASYLTHKRAVYKHRRRGILALYPNHVWSCDLAFYAKDKNANAQRGVILSVLDVFTKMAYSRSALRKTADEILKEFKSIVEEAQSLPKMLFVDIGMRNGICTECGRESKKELILRFVLHIFQVRNSIMQSFKPIAGRNR